MVQLVPSNIRKETHRVLPPMPPMPIVIRMRCIMTHWHNYTTKSFESLQKYFLLSYLFSFSCLHFSFPLIRVLQNLTGQITWLNIYKNIPRSSGRIFGIQIMSFLNKFLIQPKPPTNKTLVIHDKICLCVNMRRFNSSYNYINCLVFRICIPTSQISYFDNFLNTGK